MEIETAMLIKESPRIENKNRGLFPTLFDM